VESIAGIVLFLSSVFSFLSNIPTIVFKLSVLPLASISFCKKAGKVMQKNI